MGLFDFFSKKKEQEKEQAAQRRKETEAKELQDKLYFEAVRRDDKKRNFYFMPLTSINEPDGKYHKNSVYGGTVSFLYMEINGHRLPLYRITENFKLSLKPGKYNVKIYVQVNRDVGVEKYNEIRNIKGAHWVEQNNDKGKLTYAGFREATITVNETDMCYLLFRTNINACYNVGKVQQYGTKYVLDEIKHDYYFYQTSESELNRFCDGCIVSPTNYVYPPVDQTALQEYIKNHQHELPKSEQVAKAPAPKATVSKPATPASKTATAKPVESKPATKTTAKPVAKTAETKTTAKTTVKAAPKAETKAPVSKPVPEKPVKKTLNYPNGDKYVGYVLGDKKQGKGVLYYANGNKYEGDFANDLPHGKGTLLFNDLNNKKTKGHVYTGDFVCGKMHGFGVYAYPNGMRYEGGFANDVRDGKGKMYENQKFLFDTLYENGVDVKVYEKPQVVERYYPEEIDKLRAPTPNRICVLEEEGFYYAEGGKGRDKGKLTEGAFFFKNGAVFFGLWKWKDMHYGKIYYPNGNMLETSCFKGRTPLRGKLTYKNGDEYIGEVKDGVPHGKGEIKVHKTGDYYEGTFINGVRDGVFNVVHFGDKGREDYKQIYDNGLLIEDESLTKQKPVADISSVKKNEITCVDDSFDKKYCRYIGEMKDGKRDGFGFSFENGRIYIGEYQNDEPVGMCITVLGKEKICYAEDRFETITKKGGYCLVLSPRYYYFSNKYMGKKWNKVIDDYPDYPYGRYTDKDGLGCLSDVGKIKEDDGVYIGEVDCDGKKDGFGIFRFKNGNVFIGEFSSKYDIYGFGCWKTNTDLYIGFCDEETYHDYGMLIQNYGKSNQKVLCGKFEYGRFEGKDVFPKGLSSKVNFDDRQIGCIGGVEDDDLEMNNFADIEGLDTFCKEIAEDELADLYDPEYYDDLDDEDDFDEDIDDPSLDVDDLDDLDDLTDEELDDLVVDDFSDYSDYSKTKDKSNDEAKARADKMVEDLKQSIFDRLFGKK